MFICSLKTLFKKCSSQKVDLKKKRISVISVDCDECTIVKVFSFFFKNQALRGVCVGVCVCVCVCV